MILLVPARGGSKGVPGKNLALVGGIPLVGRAVRTARRVLSRLGEVGRVVCSTDDEAIAAVARAWGAEVPFLRPPHLASDEARSIDVVLHAIDAISLSDDATVVLLQPTSPFTALEDVLAAIAEHRRDGGAVVTVSRIGHPLQWVFHVQPDRCLTPAVACATPVRRQESAPVVCLNGAVYVAQAGWLRQQRGFLGPGTRSIEMPIARSLDIDEPVDLDVARGLVTGRPVAPVRIAGRLIGPGHPCFVIAEAGVNHNGSLDVALELIDAAAAAGADAVKFQTFHAERLVTAAAPKAAYQQCLAEPGESQLEMLRRLELSPEQHRRLVARCRERGILFLSTPFDEESADFLDQLGVPAFKIGSGELTNLPFLAHVAAIGSPMIVSTGMADLIEVDQAIETIECADGERPILLHCVSNYPANPADANLMAMRTLCECFGVPAGFSDHTEGVEVSFAAVALGASVVEKHFTLDRSLPGPDHKVSIEPDELCRLVHGIRIVEASLGTGVKRPVASEADVARVARRSLVALRPIAKGEILDGSAIGARRPCGGLPPAMLGEVLGRRARAPIREGELLRVEMLE